MSSNGVSPSEGEDIVVVVFKGEGKDPGNMGTSERRDVLRTVRDRGTFKRVAGGPDLTLSSDQAKDIRDEILALCQTLNDGQTT